MTRVVVAGALGAGLATILWFTLSPFLTHEQEQTVSWLLMGSFVVVVAVSRLRARRDAGQDPSS